MHVSLLSCAILPHAAASLEVCCSCAGRQGCLPTCGQSNDDSLVQWSYKYGRAGWQLPFPSGSAAAMAADRATTHCKSACSMVGVQALKLALFSRTPAQACLLTRKTAKCNGAGCAGSEAHLTCMAGPRLRTRPRLLTHSRAESSRRSSLTLAASCSASSATSSFREMRSWYFFSSARGALSACREWGDTLN